MSLAALLLSLQSTDQAYAVRRREFRDTSEKLEARGGLPELKEKAEKSRVRELEARVEHAKMEQELAQVKDRLSQLEERLYSGAITNVRELQAVETEHAAARRQYATLEQGLGPTLASAEEARRRHDDLGKQLADQEDAWKITEQQLSSDKNRLSKECDGISKKRSKEASGIPEDDLKFYESLLRRKSGMAVVKVERGVCQGCRVRLPLREVSKMRVSDGLISCSSCGRILLAE